MKNVISQLLSKFKHENDIHEHRKHLKCLNKYAALQNLLICYIWKSITQQYNNSKLKIIASRIMTSLNCLMVLILCQIFKIILSLSEEDMKRYLAAPQKNKQSKKL